MRIEFLFGGLSFYVFPLWMINKNTPHTITSYKILTILIVCGLEEEEQDMAETPASHLCGNT